MILLANHGGKMSDTKHLSENTNEIQVVGKLRQEIINLLGTCSVVLPSTGSIYT